MDPEQLLPRLIASPPTSLVALAALVGLPAPAGSPLAALARGGTEGWDRPAPEVESVVVRCHPVDIHHQDPRRPESLRLEAFRLHLARGRELAARLLREQHGPGEELRHGSQRALHHHPFFLLDAPGDQVDLAWRPHRPQRAPLPPPPRREEALLAFLKALPERVAALGSLAEADAFRHHLPAEAGVRTSPRPQGQSWSLVFTPPVDARALCAAVGWLCPFGTSGDVHQQRWRIGLATGEPYPSRAGAGLSLPLAPPTFGPWTVDASLLARPSGDLPGVRAGAAPAYDLRSRSASVTGITFTAATFDPAPVTPLDDSLRTPPALETDPRVLLEGLPALLAPARPPGW